MRGRFLNFQVELGFAVLVSIFHAGWTEVRDSLQTNPRVSALSCRKLIGNGSGARVTVLHRMSRESYQRALVRLARAFSVTPRSLAAPFTLRAEGGERDISQDCSVTRDISRARPFQISAANYDRGRIRIIMCQRYNNR